MQKFFIFGIILTISLILLLYKNIFLNLNTHLINWNDELFVIWILQNNISHLSNWDFSNLYETNAMYPFKYSLSFAEHLFMQSFFALILKFFTQNVFAQYNLLFIFNHLLIFVSGLLLFRKILKDNLAAIISSFYLNFSPFFFSQTGHFQMISFWPMLLSLYFLNIFQENKKIRFIYLSGFLAGIQFLSSVYLGIIYLAVAFIYFLSLYMTKGAILLNILKNFSIFMIVFSVTSFISIFGYILMSFEYHPKRDYSDYVTYAAHITDYIFPIQSSFFYESQLFQFIKDFNQHKVGESAAFIGITPLLLVVLYFIFQRKKVKDLIWKNYLVVFSIILILIGFIFSLGPRLFINGQYIGTPLPYAFILKIFPPIGIIRALSRWHLLITLGVSILMGLGFKLTLEKATNLALKRYIFVGVFILLLFEFYPTKPLAAESRDLKDESYIFLSYNLCQNPNNVILDYPLMLHIPYSNLIEKLQYMSFALFNSTKHNCKTLGGYYGYEPIEYQMYKEEFGNGFDENDIKLIRKLDINYLKINKFALDKKEYQKILDQGLLSNFVTLYEDKRVVILKII
jgi:hypothetical protein